ncbi:MAG: type-4 uracil-DNA glycosylase [Desulfurococcaceae archaeon]
MNEEWKQLENEILNCRKCRLYISRQKPVSGEGNKNTIVVIIGEAPGEKEDESGRPFVGPAGRLLTELIESIGFKREDFYITNIVKCRPPGNRDPEEDEINTCLPYLLRQLKLIKPRIIVALGRHAARTLYQLSGLRWTSMNRNHGEVARGRINGLEFKIIPTYHPASALYNPSMRKVLEDDFKYTIKTVIEEEYKPKMKHRKTLLDYMHK